MIFTQQQRRLIKRFLFLLIPYSLLRIGFYFYHLNIYSQFQPEEIFQSLWLGVRFDIAAICLLNIPNLFLSLVPSTKPKFLFFERLVFVILNSAGIIVGLDDYELYLFMGKRLSFDLFVITEDILEQLPQLILNYWYFPLLGLLFGILFYLFDRKYFKVLEEKISFLKWFVSGFLTLGMAFVGIRGGIQHKSINVQSAFIQGKNELGHLVLNSPYHFLRTLKNNPVKKITYFKSDDEAKNIILNSRDFRDGIKGMDRANVVLIIVESLSLEYMEKGYTPFLSELSKKSLFFDKHLANGRRSIEALPSLLCGLPSLMNEPISKSIFQGNKFSCFPKILQDVGYSSAFFHGGARGTMGFESYVLANGFQKYFAKDDYPNSNDFDGTWGIFDEPFLKFASEKMDTIQEPFLASVFTLSSHQPYKVPEQYAGKFPKGTLEIHESIGYTDFALKEFFEKIKNKSWFKKTIFIITADHSQKLETEKFQNIIGQYRVPLIIYAAEREWGATPLKVTQHSDIPKTVLDFVEVAGDLPATSVSVFNHDQGLSLNYSSGKFYAISGEKIITLDQEQNLELYHYDWATGHISPDGSTENPLLKAYLQYFFNGLINNNLSL